MCIPNHYRRINLLVCFLISTSIILSACNPKISEASTITVTAAASLTEPFTEIGNLFQQEHPGVTVLFNFTASQQGAQQIINGAPVDVFASASLTNMEDVVSVGLVNASQVTLFTQNKLAIITPVNNPAGIQSLQDLARPGIKLVLAAVEVPLGNYSQIFLTQPQLAIEYGEGYSEEVTKNVVSLENNARSVVTKVALGEADAGIAYLSDIHGKMEGELSIIQIPDQFNVKSYYYIAPLETGSQLPLAADFVAFVQSSSGQAILQSFGFLMITP